MPFLFMLSYTEVTDLNKQFIFWPTLYVDCGQLCGVLCITVSLHCCHFLLCWLCRSFL